MVSQVVFHQLQVTLNFDEKDVANVACRFVAEVYPKYKAISVLCSNQQQAELLDELLWQLPTDRFIPHNIKGEGDEKSAPVEILFLDSAAQTLPQFHNRQCLINFSQVFIEDCQKFSIVHEFVPSDEKGKADARVRYADYKKAGCALQFIK